MDLKKIQEVIDMVNNSEIILDGNEWEDRYYEALEDKNNEYKFDIFICSRISNKVIPVILLKGNTEAKLKKLKEFINKVPLKEFNTRIAIYTGILSPEIKDTVLKNKIDLYKRIILNHNNIYKIIEVPGTKFFEKTNNGIENAMEKVKRREKIFIIKEILEMLKNSENVNITRIIYKCNLNYRYAVALLENLIKKGMVENTEYKNGIKYNITPSGLKYLEDLQNL